MKAQGRQREGLQRKKRGKRTGETWVLIWVWVRGGILEESANEGRGGYDEMIPLIEKREESLEKIASALAWGKA